MAPDAAKSMVSFAHSREPYDRFANKTTCTLQGGPSSYSASLMSQAIIGSLPKGLDAQAKAKIQASVPASPSAAALKELSSVSRYCPEIGHRSIGALQLTESCMFLLCRVL